MIVAIHRSPATMRAYGVWLPGEADDRSGSDQAEPPSYYTDPEAKAFGAEGLLRKGSAVSWADWFGRLSELTPHSIWWDVIEVPDGLTPVEVWSSHVRQP